MSGRNLLLTYGDDAYQQGRDRLAQSAREAGFDQVIVAGRADWEGTDFARRNAATLNAPRGGGYWLWKPWLIRREVERLGENDVLLYCDASVDGFYAFDRLPRTLLDRARAASQGFVIGPVLHQHGPLRRWTKRDALVLLGADCPEIFERPQIQATWSLWRRTAAALELLEAWLAACSDPRLLTDQPNSCGRENHAGFVDHRHDQSLLSILAWRDGHEVLDLAPTGIFQPIALRPQTEMAHRLLKAPHSADRLLSGENGWRFYLQAVLARRWNKWRAR